MYKKPILTRNMIKIIRSWGFDLLFVAFQSKTQSIGSKNPQRLDKLCCFLLQCMYHKVSCLLQISKIWCFYSLCCQISDAKKLRIEKLECLVLLGIFQSKSLHRFKILDCHRLWSRWFLVLPSEWPARFFNF